MNLLFITLCYYTWPAFNDLSPSAYKVFDKGPMTKQQEHGNEDTETFLKGQNLEGKWNHACNKTGQRARGRKYIHILLYAGQCSRTSNLLSPFV